MTTYKPTPIDTRGVTVSPAIMALIEKLAEHTHEVWAAQRLADGWTYGVQRDDSAKEHPGLVPYVDLPESEKEYDRTVTLQTLKAIIALGYVISEG
jgi:RyR domain